MQLRVIFTLLVVCLCSAHLAAQSQAPTPSATGSTQEKEEKASKEDAGNNGKSRSPTTTVIQPNGHDDKGYAAEKEENKPTSEGGSSIPAWLMVGFTFVIALSAVVQVCVYCRMHDSTIRQFRAYVQIIPAHIHGFYKKGNVSSVLTRISFRADNFGQTPAKNLRMACDFFFYEAGHLRDDFVFPDIPPKKAPPVHVFPNAHLDDNRKTHFSQEVGRPFTHEELTQLIEQKIWLYTIGRAEYTDMFGKDRWCTFCIAITATPETWKRIVTAPEAEMIVIQPIMANRGNDFS